MGEPNLIEKLLESIKNLEAKYKNNELAYLSLTGKNESFIRDNIAHYLYTTENLWYKEFKRIDIAKISAENPNNITNIIELTSLYTSDILYEKHFRKAYLDKILYDFKKNKKYFSNETDAHILIIATHVKNKLTDEHNKLLKYTGGMNKILSKYMYSEESGNGNSKNDLIFDCQSMMSKYFDENKFKIVHCYVDVGEAFGIGVELHFWILEKKLCECENKDVWQFVDILAPNNDDIFSNYDCCPWCEKYKTIW